MVLKPEPFFRAVEHLRETRGAPDAVLLPSPQGRRFTQAVAEEYSRLAHLVFLCGRYEGVDERVSDGAGHRGGLHRRLRALGRRAARAGHRGRGGAAACPASWAMRSRWCATPSRAGCWITRTTRGRPSFRGLDVPEVLLSGHHGEIDRWRRAAGAATHVRTAAGPAGRRGADRRRANMAGQRGRPARGTEHSHDPDRDHRSRAAHRAPRRQVRRHRPRPREGARRRQGAHPGVRGHRHRHAPRRHARVLHGAQGVVRPGRRAHLPAALADDRQDRGRAHRQGPPREAVLPARPARQGGPHEGSERKVTPQA